MQTLDEVQCDACDVGEGNLVDQHANIVEVSDAIAFLLGVEIELVLEAGASTAGDRDAKSLLGSKTLFRAHFADHLDRFRGQDYIRKRGVFFSSAFLDRGLVVMRFFRHGSKLMTADSTVKVDISRRAFPLMISYEARCQP